MRKTKANQKLTAPTTENKPRKRANQLDASPDWREDMLETIRQLIFQADPKISEERKWIKSTNPSGVPVWSRGGIVCTGEAYKQVVKLTFFRGASLDDPDGLFNASPEGGTRRAIDIREGDQINAKAFKSLIRAAVAANLGTIVEKSQAATKVSDKIKSASQNPTKPKAKSATKSTRPAESGSVRLLAGGNPQIAKADGDTPVKAYIAAMPGWKSDLGKRIDLLVVKNVPGVRKAVKWNSPFYGVEGQGWFLSFHVLTRYVKFTFFKGTSLHPVPPGGTPKSGEARWIDVYENDALDETQFANWIQQAAAMPGWKP